MRPTVQNALTALKEGKEVSWIHGYPYFYKMFQNDVIMLMKMETSCAARPLEQLSIENFMTRNELTEFVIWDK